MSVNKARVENGVTVFHVSVLGLHFLKLSDKGVDVFCIFVLTTKVLLRWLTSDIR